VKGAAGIVVGALDRGGRVDLGAMREVMGVCSYVPVTFHRAFDELEDPLLGLEDLETLGVARVLTSGCAPDAWAGRSVLRELVETSRGVTILGGGGVRGDHVRALVEETGLTEVHARAVAIPGLVAALRGSGFDTDPEGGERRS
jgi:copper homeostasis protein